MSLAYMDGKFVDKSEIKISPSDYGFIRAMTVFELTRLYGGIPFHLDDHLRRFRNSAKTLGIEVRTTDDEIIASVKKIAAHNAYPHSVIKFYLTMGECEKPGVFGFASHAGFTPHFMILEEEQKPIHPDAPVGLEVAKRGIALKTVPFARHNSETKTINYTSGVIAARQLAGTPHDEILYTQNGYVTETTTSNFFCVIDEVLHTPARTMLEGVTRKVLLELAKSHNIHAVQSDITLQQLKHASAAFITGSFMEMMPVRLIDDIALSATSDAPVYAKLRKAFTTYINDYCKARTV